MANIPEDALLHFKKGIELLNAGKPTEAIELFDEAIASFKEFPDAYLRRGLAKVGLSLYEGAIHDCNETLILKQDCYEAYYLRGLAKVSIDHYEESIQDFGEAIRLRQDYYSAYYFRGIAMMRLDRHEEAIHDFDNAVRLKQDYYGAYYFRGLAKIGLDRYGEAIGDFNVAIRFKIDYHEAYYFRGLAKSKLDLNEKAIEDFNEAIRINPSYANSYFSRAKLLEHQGKKKLAEKDYEDFIKLADRSTSEFIHSAEVALKELREKRVAAKKAATRLKPKRKGVILVARKKAAKKHEPRAIPQKIFKLPSGVSTSSNFLTEPKPEAVMFIDICGSTHFLQEYGINEYLQRTFKFKDVVMEESKKRKYIKGLGDGFMIVFKERDDAVESAIKIMEQLKAANKKVKPAKKIHVRTGIDFGQTEKHIDDDRYGAIVVVAQRLEGLKKSDFKINNHKTGKFPEKNRIFVTYNVNIVLQDKYKTASVGMAELKGFPGHQYEIYQIMRAKGV